MTTDRPILPDAWYRAWLIDTPDNLGIGFPPTYQQVKDLQSSTAYPNVPEIENRASIELGWAGRGSLSYQLFNAFSQLVSMGYYGEGHIRHGFIHQR